MRAGYILKSGIAGLLTMALVGCDDGTHAGSNSFRNNYTTARTALESGQYDRANRAYVRLLKDAGPLQPRIQLEYAHSLLRSGAYDQAAAQAQALAQSQIATTRSAALSVLGTANHEQGLSAIASGDTQAGRHYLAAAQNAFAEVLRNDPDLDPLGAIARRQTEIKVQLKAIA